MSDKKVTFDIDYQELAVRLLCAKMDIPRPKATAKEILDVTDDVYRQEAFRMAQAAFEYIADSIAEAVRNEDR